MGRPYLRLVGALAVLVRLVVFYNGWDLVLGRRPELATPTTSQRRLFEGMSRRDLGISAYAGDSMHQPPLLLLVLRPLYDLRHAPGAWLARLAVCCCIDLVVASALRVATREALHVEERGLAWEEHAVRMQRRVPLARVSRDAVLRARWIPDAVAALYLFHPYTLLTSCAMSTATLCYACVAMALSYAVRGRMASMFWVSAAGYMASQYWMVAPGIVCVLRRTLLQQGRAWHQSHLVAAVVLVPLSVMVLWTASYFVTGSWEFVHAVYVWPSLASDLTPNVGLWWYMFTEVFDRFRPYFLTLFNLHPFIYVVPVTIRFWHRPQALTAILLAIGALLGPYPVMGDIGFASCLAAAHAGAVLRMKLKKVFLVLIALASAMLPVMWHLWLITRAGNANFYYNQSLLFNLCWGIMLLGFVSASHLRDKGLKSAATAASRS